MSALSILIVEDEAIVAADLANKLQQLGYAVAGSAATGERAIELARQHRPSLVLMDIRLGGAMDGITAADVIRRELDLPVVFLTAYSDAATLERVKTAEPFGYISKPFAERDLRTNIEIAISKHRAEQQVRQQREWLRVTLASIGDAVITCDTEARITFLNPVAEGVTGWKAEEAMGLPIHRVLRLINELPGEPCEDPTAALLRGVRPVGAAHHTTLLARDGREVPIEDSAAPILDVTGKVTGVVLVFRDVTEKRRGQEALATAHQRTLDILESISDGFFSLDREYRVTHINERGAQLIGKPPSELLNRSLWESFPEAVGSPFQKAYERTLVERIPTSVESFYAPLNTWFEARAYPANQGISVFYRDITGRKRMDDTLRFLAETGAKPGGDFFEALARHLAETLAMDYVCIDSLEAGSLEAKTVAVCNDGRLEDNVSYTLKDTPCGELAGRRVCCFPKDVRLLFPKDNALQDLRAESYIGVTLWSTAGKPIGLIAVIGRRPLVDASLAESILQLVSGRAAAELERRQADQAKQYHLVRLNRLVDISRELLTAPSSTQLMQKMVDAARQLLGARLGVCGRVYLKGRFQVESATENGGRWPFSPGKSLLLRGGGATQELMQGRNTVRYAEAQLRANPQLSGIPAEQPIRGLLGARLMGGQAQTTGLLILSDKTAGDFTSEDEALLGQLAALCSASMQQLEAAERADQRADQLATMFSSMTDGVMILNADGVVVDANRAVVERYGFNPINQQPDKFKRRLGLRYAEAGTGPARPLPSRRALAGEVVSGERIVLTTPEGSERVMVTSAAPLHTDGKVTGAVVVLHDVTERERLLRSVAQARDELELRVEERTADLQQMLELLHASELRYRMLFEAAPLGILVANRTGRVMDANPAFCQLVGLTLDEARARPAAEFYAHPGDRRRLLERLRREGPVQEFETLLRRKDGLVFPAQLQVNSLALGGKRLVLNMVQDLTRRKEAEKRIQGISTVLELFATKPSRSEYLEAAVRLLHDWCDCGGVGIRLLDAKGCLPYAAWLGYGRRFLEQEGAAQLAGGGCACIRVLQGHGLAMSATGSESAQDFFCNNVTEFLKQKHGQDPATGMMPCVEAGFESIGHVPIRFHGQFLGSIHLADRRPDRFTPEIAGFIDSVASFMGEALHRFQVEESLLESEERFRSLFEKHDAMILLLCPTSGALVDANPAAAKFYGCTREKLRTLNLRDLGLTFPALPPSPQPQAWANSWKRFETPTRLGAAETRTVEVYSSPISLHRRALVFAIMHDVTERKFLERQIVEISEKERQRIGRDLHDSLGGHLTGVALLTKALAQSMAAEGSAQAPTAAEIVDNINQAVDMTRAISHGLCPIQPGAEGLIDGLHEFVVGVRQRTGVACRLRVQDSVSIPDTVMAAHLFRIVEEAVQNALRHAKPKRIEIRLRRTRDGLLLTIWNDGRPLPARLRLEHGLGLRTMRFRANLVGGDLELRRAEAGGTEVSCFVPNGQRAQEQPPAAVPSRGPAAGKRPARGSRSKRSKHP